MTYKTGTWGEKAQFRSRQRLDYFKEYAIKKGKVTGNGLGVDGKGIGKWGEQYALQVLAGSKEIRKPSDLEWKGKKVEVKTSSKLQQRGRGGYRWKFLLTQKGNVDLFFLICKDTEGKVEYIFLIPDKVLKTKNLYIAENKVFIYFKYRLSLLQTC